VTLEEMQQATMDFWLTNFPRRATKMGKEQLHRQAMGCAKLTRLEMDALKAVGLDEQTAWTEARNLFCLAPPPNVNRAEK
jgi:hypothetical protein